MAHSHSRYAAVQQRRGQNDLGPNPVAKRQSPPRKFVSQHTNVQIRDIEADPTEPGAEHELYVKSPLGPRPITPVPPSISSTVNTKKRPATPDASPAADPRRSESPVKVSRLSHGRYAQEANEPRSVRERFEEFSLSNQPEGQRPASLRPNVCSTQPPAGSSQPTKSPLKENAPSTAFDALPLNKPIALPHHLKVTALKDSESFQDDRGRSAISSEPRINFGGPKDTSPAEDVDDELEYDLPVNESLQSQPESRPISQEQLTAEVKAIYAHLVQIEANCINVVNAQSVGHTPGGQVPQLDSAHWVAMIALHRNLLHEHHDFLLASQHPSASQPLRNLAMKYSMPARMWKHGIHNFLELLRRRLPDSLEFMLSFIYLAYQMIALLYETVPSFRETWIECLGDLSRYRMAIEDEDQSDRDTWTGVARYWYSQAADRTPTIGRLYHHLAILARSQALQQLSLYCRSLSAVQIFQSARDSITTLFDPILIRSTSGGTRPLSADSWFIRCHALIFRKDPMQVITSAIDTFLGQLVQHITRMESRWKLQGVYVAISNITSLLLYGDATSTLREMFVRKAALTDFTPSLVSHQSLPPLAIPRELPAWQLIFSTFEIALNHGSRDDVLPHIHVMLVFFWRIALLPYGSECLYNGIPWASVSKHLNALRTPESAYTRIESKWFPTSEKANPQPLPEDFLIRGLVWSQDYFPFNWFEGSPGEEERMVELDVTRTTRVERMLWLGVQIASSISNKHHFNYDYSSKCFYQPSQEQQSYSPFGSTFKKASSLLYNATAHDIL